jgi:hypothetical protein
MPQDIIIAVFRANPKIARFRRIPAPVEFTYLKRLPAKHKTRGALISAMPCITLDANFSHRITLANSVPSNAYRRNIPLSPGNCSALADSLHSALYAAPHSTTIAVRYIHRSKPIAAARPP